ncbi:hypothetical protein HV824_33885 [Myxococcus sp. AM009]|uniref:hypothetical protein n=1 Tax=Myxococcus sp. AM009 TaxID=2745137 RepID=UPI0015959BA8|nr:hypothetical protein [Myxococcus sp. AM009]
MSVELPQGMAQAFSVAAGELGMCCAAWLYVKDVARFAGDAGVSGLRDALGRSFPVLDAVAEKWLAGSREPHTDPGAVLGALAGTRQLVVVGLETEFLDALIPKLEGIRLALLRSSPFEVDWERVLSNYAGRVELVEFERFQSWAGPRSTLLTFAYGVHGAGTHVMPAWLRVTGDDVRTQFRSLVAWDVLRAPMFVYPRWLVEVDAATFTELV